MIAKMKSEDLFGTVCGNAKISVPLVGNRLALPLPRRPKFWSLFASPNVSCTYLLSTIETAMQDSPWIRNHLLSRDL